MFITRRIEGTAGLDSTTNALEPPTSANAVNAIICLARIFSFLIGGAQAVS